MGAEYEIDEIPDNLHADAREWRDKLLGTLTKADEVLMEKCFENPSTITEDEVHVAIRKATLAMETFPMLRDPPFKNKGARTLLDAVCTYLPSPMGTPEVVGHAIDPDEEEAHEAGSEALMSALIFKTATDPFVGCLCFFRVYNSHIDAGSCVFNSHSGEEERISRLFQMRSNHQNPMETTGTGGIGASVGLKGIYAGDALCDKNALLVLESINFPDSVIGIAVEPKTQKDMDRFGVGLSKLAEEDSTFIVKTNEETGQTIISGMDELHLDTVVDRLKREFRAECSQGKSQVAYKEAVIQTVDLRGVYKKQLGGRGKFADIIIKFGPADEDFSGTLQFIGEVKGGNIPKEFIPSVQKGLEKTMKGGVLAGYPLDSPKTTLADGSPHPVDSNQLSFEMAVVMAFKETFEEASPVPMESIMQLKVVTPEENMGDVIGDLDKRRGQVEDSKVNHSSTQAVRAEVLLDKMFGYVTALRTITGGYASSTVSFLHYAKIFSLIAKKILEEPNGRVDLIK